MNRGKILKVFFLFSLFICLINVKASGHQLEIKNVTVPKLCISKQAVVKININNTGDYAEKVRSKVYSNFGNFTHDLAYQIDPDERITIPIQIRPTSTGSFVLEIEAYSDYAEDTVAKIVKVKDCACQVGIGSFEYSPLVLKEGDTVNFRTSVKNFGKKTNVEIKLKIDDDLKGFRIISLEKEESKSVEFKWKAERGKAEILIEVEANCGDTEEVETEIQVESDFSPLNVLVKDQSGRVIQGAKVTVVTESYKIVRHTNSEGVASFYIPREDYIINAEYSGVAKSLRGSIGRGRGNPVTEIYLPRVKLTKNCGVNLNISYPTLAFSGESRTATASVKNTGSVTDKFDLTVHGDYSYWISPSFYQISLKPNETKKLYFSYKIPSNAATGSYSFYFTAKSKACGITDSESTITKIRMREPEIAFEAPEIELKVTNLKVNLTTGRETNWPVHLKNSGDTTEIVKINLLGLPEGWIDYTRETGLEPGQERDVYFRLEPPEDASPGTYRGEVKISYNDYTVSKSVSFFIRSKAKKFKIELSLIIYPIILVIAIILGYLLYKKIVPKPLEKVRSASRKPLKE